MINKPATMSANQSQRRFALSTLANAIALFREQYGEMTTQTAAIFLMIAQRPGISQTELFSIAGLSQSGISRNVDHLADRHVDQPGLGLVERRIDPSNRRGRVLHLTAAGKALAAALIGAQMGTVKAVGEFRKRRPRIPKAVSGQKLAKLSSNYLEV